ncbi:autotransporter domain-containing protein [Hyphomicrobium sp.]|uniref:autotransporter outer membrane beta-barrel domain-containing protein n=1 Tax=Hyphomicrobium sp. TaxID=82 RepID=UPI0025C3AB82|nr:autotransporter domain-containing protein [Hyphomicrobium sp.]
MLITEWVARRVASTRNLGRVAPVGRFDVIRWLPYLRCSISVIALAAATAAQAADVEITTNTASVDLDTYVGTTARIFPGVTVSNGISATTQAWTVTNGGAVNGPNSVKLNEGGTFVNSSGATVNGSGTAITFGYKLISLPPAGGPGYLDNYGTITGAVEGVTMWLGGTVTNYQGGIISTTGSGNAVSVGQGTSRTVINSGEIHADRTTGYSTGILVQGGPATVTNNTTGIVTGGYNGVYASASTPLTFTNNGSITSVRGPAVEAAGGGTFINTGTIQSGVDGMLISNAATVTNSGTIGSTGAGRAIVFSGAATHTLNLQTGSVLNGNVQGGTGTDNLVLQGTGTEDIAKFSNFETLSMQGSAWTLTGARTFTTSATVQSGILSVNGTLTSPTVTVQNGGILGGTGNIVGNVTNNGIVAPGNSIGTLTITGNYTQSTGSTLRTEINNTPATDLLNITGTATIESGATVNVLPATGLYTVGHRYTILTAADGRSGTYDHLVYNAPFLDLSLDYDANNVFLDVTRSSVAFQQIGQTPNQIAAAGGAESLGFGNPVYDAVLNLSEPEARNAFDQLSGELHASAKTALIEDSRFVREAALDRLRSASGTVWGRGFGSWGHTDGNGNAARLDRSTGGLFVGGDGLVLDSWRLGALAGYSHLNFNVHDRSSSGSSDNYHLGLYGGTQWGHLAFRTGTAYTWHDISTGRSVVFPGLADSLKGDYNAGTAQAFGELAYDVRAGNIGFEPFANLAYVNLHTDGFRETGGAAALRSAAADTDATFSTLGLRASTTFVLNRANLTARGAFGWRHAFGDVTPFSIMQFASGGEAFTIGGVPIAQDAAAIEAGLDYALSPDAALSVSYGGQFGSNVSDQSIKGNFNWKF